MECFTFFKYHQVFFTLQFANQAFLLEKSTPMEKLGGIAVAQRVVQYALAAAVVGVVP